MGKKALILSSGTIEGAFQVGALKEIFKSGFEPDIIAGNGIGALHAIFIANELGRFNGKISFDRVASLLENFWLKNITSPKKVIRRRHLFRLAYQILFKKFTSLYDSSPLENIILDELRVEYIVKSPVQVFIGAINTFDGNTRYFGLRDSDLIDAIFASYSIPFIMPYVLIEGEPYIDAAERHIIPTEFILNKYDIDEMVIILCQPTELDVVAFNPGDLMQLIYRTKHITENELLMRDLAIVQDYSTNHKKFKYSLVKPDKELFVSMTDFSIHDIERMIDMGRQAAHKTATLTNNTTTH